MSTSPPDSNVRGPGGGRGLGWLFLSVIPFAAAVNGHVLPDTFDNLVYLAGAESLLHHGDFTFGGWHVWDWPPGFSALLAIPRALGLSGVVPAKIVVAVAVAIAVVMAHRLLVLEGWRDALPAAVLFPLAPYAFLQGTRVMADWPYVAVSFLFLAVLQRLHRAPTLAWALLAGALLGAASLVRHVGVLLGVAVAWGAWQSWRVRKGGGGLRAAVPEALAATLGGAMFVGWKLHLLPFVRAGEAWSEYQQSSGFLFHPDGVAWSKLLLDVLFHGTALGERAGVPGAALGALALVIALIVVVGFVAHLRGHGLTPVTAYVLANLVLILCLEWKWSRYLLPVAPFIVAAWCEGVRLLGGWFAERGLRMGAWARPAIVAWGLALLGMDGVLLVRGNGTTHRGLSPLASPTPESFYLGEWRDVFRVCDEIAADPTPGHVLWLGRDDLKYPAYWCNRPVVRGDAAGSDPWPQPPSGDGGQAWWAEVCGRRAPFVPGTGLALNDDRGQSIERPGPASVPRPPPGTPCPIAFVVAPEGATLPLGVPSPARIERWGSLRLWRLSPDRHGDADGTPREGSPRP